MSTRRPTCIDKFAIHGNVRAALDEINRLNAKPRTEFSANEAASDSNFRWDQHEIVIRFLDGSSDLHQRVKQHAEEWLEHANLQFTWANTADAHVKISFQDPEGGYWSYLGSEAINYPGDEATMNFEGWTDEMLEDDDWSLDIKRVVLHEFGHMLGLIHEHQSPKNGIQWNEEEVFKYYKEEEGWDEKETRFQVLDRYNTPTTRSTEWDSESIMQYPIESFLTKDGFSVDWNTELSIKDIEFVKSMYP